MARSGVGEAGRRWGKTRTLKTDYVLLKYHYQNKHNVEQTVTLAESPAAGSAEGTMWANPPPGSIPAKSPRWGKRSPSPEDPERRYEVHSEARSGRSSERRTDVKSEPRSDGGRSSNAAPVTPERRGESASKRRRAPAPPLIKTTEDSLRRFKPHTDVASAVPPPGQRTAVRLPLPPPPPPRESPSAGTALALTKAHRTTGVPQMLEFIAEGASSSSSARLGTTTITTLVHNATKEPDSEYEHAHRMMEDLQHITEPHLLMSVLKSIEARALEVGQERAAEKRRNDKRGHSS